MPQINEYSWTNLSTLILSILFLVSLEVHFQLSNLVATKIVPTNFLNEYTMLI